ATWYQTKLARFDLATRCLEEVLDSDPTNDAALAKLSDIARRSQQWRQLGALLSRRAEGAPAPLARDLKTEAAELLERQLADPGGARDLYAQVVEEDPGHGRAVDGLCRILEREADFRGLAKLLERTSAALLGEGRRQALCRLAELYEQRLEDADQ